MYLKEIKVHGFKSFADKTTIKLNNEITAIVGPNGSGKSNIVDAVRWVLGEQSIKSLRGDGNMADVIFSGSSSRNPMNIASVALVFDNSDKYLPLDFSEVSIKRRVYKDGTNEYFLNNQKVRLSDINNLLLDSGMAKESFNIISQGNIDDIISNKPTDRRVIFEEASGVLKYKKRKEQANRKLDKTHDNINRVNDIINELEPQLEPLKKQADMALEYNNLKEELKNFEISLITYDVNKLNSDYQKEKKKIGMLNDELLNISTGLNSNQAKEEKFTKDLVLIEDKIASIQKDILSLTSMAEKLNGRKDLIIERKKYEVPSSKLHDELVSLKEDSLQLKNSIYSLENDIKNLKDSINKIDKSIDKYNIEIDKINNSKDKISDLLQKSLMVKNELQLKIDFLSQSLSNGMMLPASVKSVLNNPKLNGIHDILGNIISTDDKYSKAITTILGAGVNNIVVDDQKCAKEAIKFLNNIGRATFFPLNVIKKKWIDFDVLSLIKNLNFFVRVASDLVECDSKYNNIILNQLGNVLVTDNLSNAIILSKKINFKYRIVTLDGEVIHVGGALTGGKNSKIRNVVNDKHELEEKKSKFNILLEDIKDYEDKILQFDIDIKKLSDSLFDLNKKKLSLETLLEEKQKQFSILSLKYEKVNNNIKGTNNIVNNGLEKEEEEVINKYYKVIKEKEEKEKELQNLQINKADLNDNLEDYKLLAKKFNLEYNSKSLEVKELEISVNRMDVKLDNLLNILNEEYNMTYDRALKDYFLDVDYDIAKNKVSSLKKRLKEIGDVNPIAPDEYARVSERYEFLLKQINDLNEAENTLLQIIDEMDKVMVREFKKTFDIINKNFSSTFKDLFGGGNATLSLTDPNNLLETGVEIKCCPPGKKLSSISLLSGGEKTLTAISLLFAIIKSKPAPFCILDEVEAALDEANVDTFGKYVTKLKDLSQFIVITHKKKTMEYANVLYGVTMQESGVSKLVSVKLNDIEK